ncbi:ABC transporter ATP-binding protein [Xanthobacter sp. KR7-65]|uniref:ABC transporter ATP-binding protein n=1 Tax=Xanthobacter sp. KR7-65 TaxID=3156612 RepID=UPI0032B44BE3
MLETKSLSKRYGGLVAVADVDFRAATDEVVAIIGPNGAGKTTFFNLLSGFQRPSSGEMSLDGKSIMGLQAHQVSNLGVVRTFQVCRPFPDLSTLENVVAGAYAHCTTYREAVEVAEAVLEEVGLFHKRRFLANYLTLPDMKRLELARALATRPRYLLLDEVMAGLNVREQHEVGDVIEAIHRRGVGVVLVEHSITMVVRLGRRVMCLSAGRKIAEGTAREVLSDPDVQSAYMGAANDEAA